MDGFILFIYVWMYVFIHQKTFIKHVLWLGRVLDDEDTAANKTDKNTCSCGSYTLVEGGKHKT